MNVAINQMGLNFPSAPISPDHGCYRPPSWPPPLDWVVSEDARGDPLSRWGDDAWDFSPWVGTNFKLRFAGRSAGKRTQPLGPQNQYLMRLLATWMIWGPGGDKAWLTLRHRFGSVRRIVALCEEEGILASDLMRYPKVLEQVPQIYSSSDRENIIVSLDRLLRAKDQLGFTLIDQTGISCLSRAFLELDQKEPEQTAYIPPRIWTYQVLRLRDCLEEFLRHRQQIVDCFNFCVDAYAQNFGSLGAALLATSSVSSRGHLPFADQGCKHAGTITGRVFHGPFGLTAERYGIAKLLKEWVPRDGESLSIQSISRFLNLVQHAGQAYIANFTLQRIGEIASLRTDCLLYENDPVVGRIAVIRGETTKTDPDSDARWPTSPSVQLAVDAMTVVARLRMRCAAANPVVNCSRADQDNPILSHHAFEPWSPSRSNDYSTRPHPVGYHDFIQRFPRLFDLEQLKVTQDDIAKARMFTPNLDKGGRFKVGIVWPMAFHQLRRTGAINMFASGLLCDSSIQFLLKHRTLLQAIYYGRNHTRLRFNLEIEGVTTEAKYEVMAKQIESLVTDRYVSPLGPQRKQEIVVNLISVKECKTLTKAGKLGEISFRETRLGGCTKRGHCDYGGIESVARCAGGDGDKPCRDAVFDRLKQSPVRRELGSVELQMQAALPDSPRELALSAERQGLRNYLDVVLK